MSFSHGSESACATQKRAEWPNAATIASSVRAPDGSTVGCMSLYMNSGAVAGCSRRRRGRGEPPGTVGSIGSGTNATRVRGVTTAGGGCCTGDGGCIPCEAMCLASESDSKNSARERPETDCLPNRIDPTHRRFLPPCPPQSTATDTLGSTARLLHLAVSRSTRRSAKCPAAIHPLPSSASTPVQRLARELRAFAAPPRQATCRRGATGSRLVPSATAPGN